MGFPVFDYLRDCDPLEFNFRLLAVHGFWPLETKSKKMKIVFSIYSFVTVFILGHIFFGELLDLYLVREDIVNVTKNLCCTSSSIIAVFKQIVLLQKVDDVKALYSKIKAFKASLHLPKDVATMEKADRLLMLATKSIYAIAIPCIATWMVYPALQGERLVPFPYRVPNDDWSTPVYEIVYAFETLCLVLVMVTILSNDLVYYGMLIRINAEYDILISKLDALDMILNTNDEDDEVDANNEEVATMHEESVVDEVTATVKEWVNRHQNILEEIELLKVAYSRSYFIHFLAIVFLLGAIILDITVVSQGIELQMLQRIMYSGAGILDTFLCCLFTNLMQDRGYILADALYSTPWYKLNPSIRKDIQKMIARALKPNIVKIANCFPITLQTFREIMRMSYNITAFLHQTMQK